MDWAATYETQSDWYEQTCDYCGCRFRYSYPTQPGHNEREEYYCPDCHQEFGVRASNSPRVHKISDRTDGRTNNYPHK